MRVLVVGVNLGNPDYKAHIEEFTMLAASAGAEIVDTIEVPRDRPDAKYFIGSGKVEEIHQHAQASKVALILFDQPLSPAQQRNLERVFAVRVVDRVALILDIFALRAKSHEGKLQVELAQLQHLSTRLTRLWTHLERQRGGIGMRGPGESQLEMDRRMIGARVKVLRERLDKVKRQRTTQRRARVRQGALSVALVGYTNAGKSTLFNALTRTDAYVANQLFATLDTTTRRVWIEGAGSVVISDTVGFIQDLPPTLIAAFRATLEETVQADLLLHVVDVANPQHDAQIQAVEKVLSEIGAGTIPVVLVYNKIDCIGLSPRVDWDAATVHGTQGAHGTITRVFISAAKRIGLEALCDVIVQSGDVGNNASNNQTLQFE